MTQQEQFAAKVQQLIAQSRALPPEAKAVVAELLNEARKRIIAEIADLDPSSFLYAQRTALKNSIDRSMEQFRAQATQQVEQLEEKSFQQTLGTASSPLAAAGYDVAALGQVSRSALTIVQGYTADLITGISRKAAADINAAIARAFLGGQSTSDIIAQIGRALGGGKFDGLFGPIGERATTIAVNEVLRVQSLAGQARLEQMAERHPDLQKKWVHLPAAKVPRIMHIAASGQTVPVDKPFVVAGEELMFPRDPNGSPENTINCHCVSVPAFERQDLVPTQDDRDLLRRLGISVSRAA